MEKSAVEDVYNIVRGLRKGLDPLLRFNLEHAGSKLDLRVLWNAGWDKKAESHAEGGGDQYLARGGVRIAFGRCREEHAVYFRWMYLDGNEQGLDFALARRDLECAGLGPALLHAADLEMLWEKPGGFREDLTENERCVCCALDAIVRNRGKGDRSVARRLFASYVRAILTDDDPDGRELIAQISHIDLMADILDAVADIGWKEATAAILMQLIMMFEDDLDAGDADRHEWKAVYKGARLLDCWRLAALAAEKTSEPILATLCRFKTAYDDVVAERRTYEDVQELHQSYCVSLAERVSAAAKAYDAEHTELAYLEYGVKVPSEWQAYSAVADFLDPSYAIDNYPRPALQGPRLEPYACLIVPKEGVSADMLFYGLLPGEDEAIAEYLEKQVEACTLAYEGFSTRKRMYLYYAAASSGCSYSESYRTEDHGRFEIDIVTIKGVEKQEDGSFAVVKPLYIAPDLSSRIPAGVAGMRRIAKFWELNPWCNGAFGEARVELENGVNIRAIMPYYQNDWVEVYRGMEMNTRVLMLGTALEVDEPRRRYETKGNKVVMTPETSYMITKPSLPWQVSEACYELRGKVVSVRTATMRGVEGVVRVRIRMKNFVLPFDLDFYINREKVRGRLPRRGDVVIASGWMYADPKDGVIPFAEFRQRYPEGREIPKEIVPGEMYDRERRVKYVLRQGGK